MTSLLLGSLWGADAPQASYCISQEFLTASTLRQLIMLLVQRQSLFMSSDRGHDAVRVLDDLGELKDSLAAVVLDALSDVAPRCGLELFDSADVDMRLVSRGDSPSAQTRDEIVEGDALGFVLFVHREPRQFEGGALHLRSSAGESIIEPSQNSIVFFRSSVAVQVGAVRCASGALIDSCLTLEGWIRDARSRRE